MGISIIDEMRRGGPSIGYLDRRDDRDRRPWSVGADAGPDPDPAGHRSSRARRCRTAGLGPCPRADPETRRPGRGVGLPRTRPLAPGLGGVWDPLASGEASVGSKACEENPTPGAVRVEASPRPPRRHPLLHALSQRRLWAHLAMVRRQGVPVGPTRRAGAHPRFEPGSPSRPAGPGRSHPIPSTPANSWTGTSASRASGSW